MLLELKLRKIGSSVGVILPKEAFAHLKIEEGDSVTGTDGTEGSLRLSPHKADAARQMEAAQDVLNRYRNTLHELAN